MAGIITPVPLEERTKLGIRPGDTVRVHQKIIEKGKTRTQAFEGLVIAVKHGTEAGATFTVRATLSGIGVERIFPLYAPFIEKIEIVKRSKVAREVKRQLRNMRMMGVSTDDFKEEPKPEVTVEEVIANDPEASAATGEEMTPVEEVATEAVAVELANEDPATPADAASPEAKEEEKAAA
jgi:large subunit ribosomal protein L19